MTISIIAAIGRNRELGKNGALLWHIPEDMAYFRTLTMGKPVIMGRRTYDSLPARFRPLPGRTNIVLQRSEEILPAENGVVVVHTVADAIAAARDAAEVFVIGGASIYTQFLPHADRLYLTHVDALFPQADVFFPAYEQKFRAMREHTSQDAQYAYTFTVYQRI